MRLLDVLRRAPSATIYGACTEEVRYNNARQKRVVRIRRSASVGIQVVADGASNPLFVIRLLHPRKCRNNVILPGYYIAYTSSLAANIPKHHIHFHPSIYICIYVYTVYAVLVSSRTKRQTQSYTKTNLVCVAARGQSWSEMMASHTCMGRAMLINPVYQDWPRWMVRRIARKSGTRAQQQKLYTRVLCIEIYITLLRANELTPLCV